MERIRAALRGGARDAGAGGAGQGIIGNGGAGDSSGGAAGLGPGLGPAAAPYARHAGRPSLLPGNGGAGGRSSFATGVERFGVQSKGAAYLRDPFHSLVSLPTWRFYSAFFGVYLFLYCAFALLYLTFSDECIRGLEGRFSHALWIASRTAATLGYSDLLTPLPDCAPVNLLVMLQVITCSLVNFVMLGLVFARFSAPSKRARSIRFARRAVARRWYGGRHAAGAAPAAASASSPPGAATTTGGGGAGAAADAAFAPPSDPYWCVEVRVANLRKHTLLAPNVRLFVASLDSVDTGRFALDELPIESPERQLLALSLGLSATVTHVVRPDSPLYNLSLAEMEARLFELLVFVDGTDAMTSRQMQARHSYPLGEDGVLAGRGFAPMHLGLVGRGGRLGLDFTLFDETVPAVGTNVMGLSGVELRHLTFRRLAEAERGGGATAGGAAAAAAGRAGVTTGGGGGGYGGGGFRSSAGGAGIGGGAVGAGALPPKPPPPPPAPAPAAAAPAPLPGVEMTTAAAAAPAPAAVAPVVNPFARAPPGATSSGGGAGGTGGGGAGGVPSSSFSNVHL